MWTYIKSGFLIVLSWIRIVYNSLFMNNGALFGLFPFLMIGFGILLLFIIIRFIKSISNGGF